MMFYEDAVAFLGCCLRSGESHNVLRIHRPTVNEAYVNCHKKLSFKEEDWVSIFLIILGTYFVVLNFREIPITKNQAIFHRMLLVNSFGDICNRELIGLKLNPLNYLHKNICYVSESQIYALKSILLLLKSHLWFLTFLIERRVVKGIFICLAWNVELSFFLFLILPWIVAFWPSPVKTRNIINRVKCQKIVLFSLTERVFGVLFTSLWIVKHGGNKQKYLNVYLKLQKCRKFLLEAFSLTIWTVI